MLKKMTEFEKDPTKTGMIQLPEIKGIGIDEEGRKLYTHYGKQYREIFGWLTNSLQTAFGKSNPVFQALYKQVAGSTPSRGGSFPVKGGYKYGKQLSWDATDPGSFDNLKSRGLQLAEDLLLPFSLSALLSHGPKTTAVVGGALPVSKGMSLHSATPYIEKYLKTQNYKKLSEVKKTLLNNGYKYREIKKKITLMRNEIKKDRREAAKK